MEMREGFVFYHSFSDAIECLPEENQLDAFRAITEYAFNGTMPENGIALAIVMLAKPQIDANNQRYENGKKGGRPKTCTEPKENQEQTKQKPNHNQTITNPEPKEKDKDKYKYKEKENIKEKEKTGDPVLDEAIKNYKRHRTQLKAPLTDRALDLALHTLEKLAPGDTATKVKIIDQSIERGWKGLFPLKDEQVARPTTGITRGTDYDALVRRMAR